MKVTLTYFSFCLLSFIFIPAVNFGSSSLLKKSDKLSVSNPASVILETGVIAVNPTKIYYNDVAGDGVGLDTTIVINNTGQGSLSISAINISGANLTEFVLSNLPTLPAIINAGGSISFSVSFNPSSVGLKTALISVNSNDGINPVVSIPVRGLGTSGLGGTNEPSLQSILNLLEIPVTVGDDNTSTAIINSSALLQKAPLLGEELNISHFQKAGSGDVTITPLAVFGPTDNATVLGMGWYKSGDIFTKSELFNVSNNPLSNGQTVNVNFNGSLSFNPNTDTFGFYSRWPFFNNRYLYSEDDLNTFPGSIPHHVRVYPYKDINGAIVSNAYIVAFEENTSGFDYQDLVFVVKNVKPATPISNALLFIENPDKFPANDQFVFSRVQTPWSGDGITYNSNHDSLKVRIHNKGINPLVISDIKLSDNTTWKIEKFNGSPYTPGAGLPATVTSGGFVDVIVKFTALNQDVRVKVLHETLTVISNDDQYPSKTIFLHGLWQKSGEGSHEPYAQEIIDAFGFKTNTGFIHTDPDFGDSTKLKGDEIRPSYFVRVNTSLPVSITQMASYHGCCTSAEKFQWYAKGSSAVPILFRHLGTDAQMLLPRSTLDSSIAANATINPNTPFGFRVGNESWTDAAKNWNGKIAIRVWKAFDSKGNIIPNSYILSNDYISDTSNFDYNDNLYFVSNVKPYIGTAFNSPLNVAPSDLDFGEHILQTNDSLELNISSGGKVYSDGSQDPPIVISSVTITGENQSEFSASMPLKSTLAPQEVTTIKVKFKPVSEGLKIADLFIYYNNSLSPLRVPLYGIGTAPGTAVITNYQIKSGSTTSMVINGKTWDADTLYAFDNLEPYTNTSLSEVAGTDEDALYLREQSSDGDKKPFRYQIPLPNGDYTVRLHFAEIVWGAPGSGFSKGAAGSRVMSVELENQMRLINFDAGQTVGAATAIIKNLPVTVNDGNLDINFLATVNRPMVNAIEVYSFISGALANNFLDLKGILKDDRIELEWTANNGRNTKYFEVQKSTNKADFVTLKQVPPVTSTQGKYNFIDNNPETTNNYYRIKEVDLNGAITYSKIIRIDFTKAFTMQFFPNPVKKKIRIQFTGINSNQKANLSIQNSAGSVLKKISVVLPGEKIEVDVSSLSAGLYIIRVAVGNSVICKKFLKIN